jgi:hypothetical protein
VVRDRKRLLTTLQRSVWHEHFTLALDVWAPYWHLYKIPLQTLHSYPSTSQLILNITLNSSHFTFTNTNPNLHQNGPHLRHRCHPGSYVLTNHLPLHTLSDLTNPPVALTTLAAPQPQSCGGQAIGGSDCGFNDQCLSCRCVNGICARPNILVDRQCGGQAIPGSDCGFDDQCRSCHCRNGICT